MKNHVHPLILTRLCYLCLRMQKRTDYTATAKVSKVSCRSAKRANRARRE